MDPALTDAIAIANSGHRPQVLSFHDAITGSVAHLAWCNVTRASIIVDPVLIVGSDLQSRSLSMVNAIEREARDRNLDVKMVVDTHVHADHVSAAGFLAQRFRVPAGIGYGYEKIRDEFFAKDASQGALRMARDIYQRHFVDGDRFNLGLLNCLALSVPGHTLSDVAYLVGCSVFCGDTLFLPHEGTARTDFGGGDPQRLFGSIGRLLSLPPQVHVHVCHSYQPTKNNVPTQSRFSTTVMEQLKSNIHLRPKMDESRFVAMRRKRDSTLATPRLMDLAIRENLGIDQQ